MRFWPTFALFSLWLMPAPASAVGQGEASLSAGVGLAIAVQDQPRAGAQVEFRLLRGLSDSWAARLGLETTWIPTSGAAIHFTTQSAGLTWAADVLRLVPFVDFGIAVADIRGGGMREGQRLGPQGGIGADYLVSRHLTVSLLARVDYFALRLAGGHETAPTQITVGAHLARVF
jgi:hypothetical protein